MKYVWAFLAWFLGRLGTEKQKNDDLRADLEVIHRANEAAEKVSHATSPRRDSNDLDC